VPSFGRSWSGKGDNPRATNLTVRKHFRESRTFLASGTVHAPECRAGLGQHVSSANEGRIARAPTLSGNIERDYKAFGARGEKRKKASVLSSKYL
jgi:hypothetical protein